MAIDDAPPRPPLPPPGGPAGPGPATTAVHRRDRSWWNWLILVPLVVSLTVPVFDRGRPALGGVPFFYWYQIVAIAVGVLSTIAVFRAHERHHDRPSATSTER